MKKYFLIVVIMVSGIVFSQDNTPVLEAEEQLVKATYFYDNGTIQQVGYFKDGKLDGKWTTYDESGNVTTIAEYTDGVKSGKWKYFSNKVTVSEVDFRNNKIVAVKKFNHNDALVKN